MIGSMTMAKIAVSLPAELVDDARRAVREGKASSVSAYVADAMAARSNREHLGRYVASLIEEFGEPSPDDYAWADQQLDRAGVAHHD